MNPDKGPRTYPGREFAQRNELKEPTTAERKVSVVSRAGLHARPAAHFVEAASTLPLEVTIGQDGEPAEEAMDAANILLLMSLGSVQGDIIVLHVEGD